MPLITWISTIFPESQAPFTVAEITTRLQQFYSLDITKGQVYAAFQCLQKRPAVAEFVQPLDDGRPAYYSAEGARRVTRYLIASVPPAVALQPVCLSERARLAIKPTSSQPQPEVVQNTGELAVAS